jgi:hypothetical protein
MLCRSTLACGVETLLNWRGGVGLLQAVIVAAGVLITLLISALRPGPFRLRMVKLRRRLNSGRRRPLVV